ncbi:MAG: DUF438 domain-containing protein [Spirochaetales bacterium]|nr:DUF438 domain-containing protein [Spirochaetales bacterium]
MSEYFSDQEKQEKLKTIIKRLHQGESVDAVKQDFHKLIRNVSPEEISRMEQTLLEEGFPIAEIQRLCEVHIEVFKDSLSKQKTAAKLPGHPVHTFLAENKEIKQRIKQLKALLRKVKRKKQDDTIYQQFKSKFNELKPIELHYQRKENQLFPYLEQKGFTGPSKVMWGKHNEIRKRIKQCDQLSDQGSISALVKECGSLFSTISSMIFMEEKILFPTALKKLTDREWAEIRKGEKEIGYAWIKPGNVWDAGIAAQKIVKDEIARKTESISQSASAISLDVGALSTERINLMLKSLPFDVTYVDEHDKVLYYTGSEERVFPRSPAIIGRNVQNCHPQKSVHVVENILKAFKEKKQQVAEFWITMNERFIHIRYFPIYDEQGTYKGVIEVTQDITDIKKLEGQRRLLDW